MLAAFIARTIMHWFDVCLSYLFSDIILDRSAEVQQQQQTR